MHLYMARGNRKGYACAMSARPNQYTKKSLGQHFLHDLVAIQRIVSAVPKGVSAVEIGPGPGAITEPLLKHVDRLTVIEMDDRFAAHWQDVAQENSALSVIHGDVMQELDNAIDLALPEWIVGNLPYNISGPLTAKLAGYRLSGGMVLMYQREVAERILAGPGSKTYGGLSVMARHHYSIKRLLTLPPGAFSPPPKVHSAVIVLTPHGRTPPCSYEALQKAVRQGFSHRRKTINNNFRNVLSADDWAALEINPATRPEQIDYDGWVKITRRLFAG